MSTRPVGTKFKKCGGLLRASNVQVDTGVGNLYSLFLNWRGCTAGDRFLLHDGTDETGTVICEVILVNTGNDGITVPLPAVGKQYTYGLYCNFDGLVAGEFNVSIGYDPNR